MIIDAPTGNAVTWLKKLWQQAFGDTEEFINGFFSAGFSPARCRCVSKDGVPVAALYWFDCTWQGQPVAYLYAIATEKSCRGQGLFRKLLEDTHHHLAAQGYVGTVLVPATPSLFSMYEKFGYRSFCPMKKVTLRPQGTALVQQICPENYLCRRNQQLPENAVRHTEQALAFYRTYGKFYAGDNFLFSAAREENTLYFQEFFGDPACIPGILSALSTAEGVVRLPGGTPLAMYCNLTESDCMPDFFNMSLD